MNPSLLEFACLSSTSLTPLQSQVDGLVGGFAEQATDLRTIAAITTGSLAYRMGRVGLMGMGSGSVVRALSVAGGLGAEVSAFELTNRGLTSISVGAHGRAPLHPNLWRWSGTGGLRQGLLSSFITFGALKGAGNMARGENILVQHLFQDSAMVMGHQAAGALGAGPRPTGSLAEQFLHAEATNLQLGAGMALAHRMAPSLHGIERGLNLALSSPFTPEQRLPRGQPIEYLDGEAPPFPTAQLAFGMAAGSRRPGMLSPPVEAPQSKNHILMSVKHEGGRAAEEGEAGNSGIHVRSPRVREFSVQSFTAPKEVQAPSEPAQERDRALEIPTLPAGLTDQPQPSSRGSSVPRAALEVSEARYQTLLKALPDPIFMIDREGNFLHIHAERDDLLFLPAEQMLGTNIRDLPFSPELKEWGMGVIQKAVESGEPQWVEYVVPWRDGSTHIQEARVVPDVQSDGTKAVLVVVRDVTKERRAEEIHVAAERLEGLQHFSQGIAHDLSNLLIAVETYAGFGSRNLKRFRDLAAMASQENFGENPALLQTFQSQLIGFHNVLTRGSRTPEAAASGTLRFMALQAAEVFDRTIRDQETVVQQTERIRSLIADLKELGQKPKEGPPFDLHTLLEEGRIRGILDRTENLEGQPELLTINLAADPWWVPGPQENIARVIENLIVNARDTMEGQAERRLTLQTERVPVTEEILAQVVYPPIGPNVKPGDFMRLRVEDTGQGIDETTLKQIFEPFFTTKERSPSRTSGSGLGLAIALHAIQNAGGFITVKSQPGIGTAFDIYLPAIDRPALVKASPALKAAPDLPLQERILKTPILIVDDEPIVANSMRRILSRAGFDGVVTVGSASDALALSENFGLAMLDINLLGMNGVKLMGLLREARPDLPCILVTGNDHAGHARHLREGPSLRFLSKPYDLKELVALVKGTIETSLKK